MTRFRFSDGLNMRLPCIAMLAIALGLSACGGKSYGVAADGFFSPQIANVYIPLETSNIFATRNGAAVVIAPGVAATNAHNANIVDPALVIGGPNNFDLLYFRTAKTETVPTATPIEGEAVLAYGQGTDGSLRVSQGVIHRFWPAAFGYVSDAGPGFSGGPVVDAKTGALLGITYGYIDKTDPSGRLMVAYNAAFVASEFAALKAK